VFWSKSFPFILTRYCNLVSQSGKATASSSLPLTFNITLGGTNIAAVDLKLFLCHLRFHFPST
jgi:hypothetical protein